MQIYAMDPAWAEVAPILQDDGGPDPLAAIAYTEEYSEAMAYLRAVMAAGEHSGRVLNLTEHIIRLNPGHYTVWLYRAKTLFALGSDLKAEIKWLNGVALQHQKNYQIWHHRQVMMDKLGDPRGEAEFMEKMFDKDAKNYHVWSYRQWLVRRFDLWDNEMGSVEDLLARDIRNNSAWNHRYYIVFGRGTPVDDVTVEREISYAKDAIAMAPQNQSPWNYLRGVLEETQSPLSSVTDFVLPFADVSHPDTIRSSHALDLLAAIYGEDKARKQDAAKALDLLAEKYDPIRANYWNYRKALLDQVTASA